MRRLRRPRRSPLLAYRGGPRRTMASSSSTEPAHRRERLEPPGRSRVREDAGPGGPLGLEPRARRCRRPPLPCRACALGPGDADELGELRRRSWPCRCRPRSWPPRSSRPSGLPGGCLRACRHRARSVAAAAGRGGAPARRPAAVRSPWWSSVSPRRPASTMARPSSMSAIARRGRGSHRRPRSRADPRRRRARG